MKSKYPLTFAILIAFIFALIRESWGFPGAFLSIAQAAHPSTGSNLFLYPEQTWMISTVESGNDVGKYTSIALDSNGNPHISYYDVTNQDLKYARWTGATWETQTIDSTGDVGAFTSLALDSTGNPHISYADATNKTLKYARRIAASWHIQTIDTVGGTSPSSLALDGSNRPHISYNLVSNFPSSNSLKYAYWTGNNWSIHTVDNNVGNLGSGSSLKVDIGGNPHICYGYSNFTQPITFVMRLRYARFTAGGWQLSLVDSTGRVGDDCSIALDTTGNPHISYLDSSNSNLKYARWTGSSWQIHTLGSVGNWPEGTSIFVDSNGFPHISYYDSSGEGNLKYTRWTGTTWQNFVVDSAANTGQYSSLVVDSSWNVHISYYDGNNGDLKYARRNLPPSTPTPPSPTTMVPGTPAATPSPGPMNRFVYLPLILNNYSPPILSTATPTSTSVTTTLSATLTNTPTRTATLVNTLTSTPSPSPSPTPSATSTLTLTLSPTLPPCGIHNCGFEQGPTFWAEYSSNGYPLILQDDDLPNYPHGGQWAVWLGGANNEISFVEQSVYVPTDRPYLSYWNWIFSTDYCGYDFAFVRVNGNIAHQYDLCESTQTDDWVLRVINLGAYAGQTVILQVRVETDGTIASSLFVDDFSFQSTGE